ncbi:MAG: M20/M25/M40 family metallo-hydrolase [Candidatus Aminicenantes bacterium]|nr:MAG: M20/M25/M40 family metallo-hydrolase [Candidatus Aminicenantes bacterium]
MRRVLSVVLILFLITAPGQAKKEKIEFDAQAAWSYIKAMCTDEMEGRKSGQPGGTKGEEYIASKFKGWGLEPAGDNGTYFQNFTIEHRNIGQGATFEIISNTGRRDLYYNEDWRVGRYSGSGHFMADIVFVGYGIHAPDKGFDEYAGVDVKGKVILMADQPPDSLQKKFREAASTDKRVEAAQKHGALGLIVFQASTIRQTRFYGISVSKEMYNPDFVILSAERQVIEFMFKNHPVDARQLTRNIATKNKTNSFNTGSKAYIGINSIYDPKRATRNVLAKITGSDPKLKDESVIIGGHMDHLGVSPLGDIYYGANDNASGTAVAMEVARIMKLNNAKPKRTVIFAGWAGEEQGLLGSYYYADNPEYPIDKTIAYINMDMVGHGEGKTSFNGEYYGPQIWEVLKAKLPKEILDTTAPRRGGPGGSDHTPFLQKGVPAFSIGTRGAVKYHQPYDHSDLIRPEILKTVGDLVHATVKILANEEQNFILPQRQEVYHLKQQDLINFKLANVEKVVEHRKDAKDSHVDVQLAFLEGDEGLSGDQLRINIIQKLLDLLDKYKKAKGLSLFSPTTSISSISRLGRTTVLPGLVGIRALKDDLRWAEILAKQGLYFVYLDDVSFLFGDSGLSEDGKKTIKALNKSGLLSYIKGADTAQIKVLLKTAHKPFIFVTNDIPEKEVLDLIKDKESAIGLILSSDTDPAAYFKKIDAIKEAIGSQYVMMVNEPCFWKDEGKNLMLKVITEIIKGKYERADLSNIFSRTFLRVLNEARGTSQ